MSYKHVTNEDKKNYNKLITHPLQSYEWGEFREKTGIQVIRRIEQKDEENISAFTLTLHALPRLNQKIGYLPKGNLPDQKLLNELHRIGQDTNTIFIQLEPGIENNENATSEIEYLKLRNAAHPLFTKYTFLLDLTPSEETLLSNMHSKTRYNIRIAQKHNVTVQEDNSNKAFDEYIRLTKVTTSRQKFYAHTISYHQIQWQVLPHTASSHTLSSHLLTATYKNETLVAWIVFIFGDTLYYPYGASSSQYREVMASNLMMWEAIRFGKKMGLKKFDMWGSLGPDAKDSDPWYGFHKFKQGYGATLTEYIGSFDYVINPLLYAGYTLADKLRWAYLRLKK